MKIILDLIDLMSEELECAKEYAERYIELKADGDIEWFEKFQNMSRQEIEHATIIRDYAAKKIESLRTVYIMPERMASEWEKASAEYIERVAWIKQMLNM